MSEVQRARIVGAAVETLEELGYDDVTVTQIVARAGVSRKTFYEHFEDREGCFVAALEEARAPRPVATFALAGQGIKSLSREGGGLSGQDRNRNTPGFRVTYRTVRVLEAIAEQPGASNRQVAEQAGVPDEGQISRMLARLEGLGVVARDGGPANAKRSRGEANAWWLTAWGEEVRKVVEG